MSLHRISLKTLLCRIKTPREQMAELVELAEVACRDGILAMEQRMADIDDPFLRRASSSPSTASIPTPSRRRCRRNSTT